MINVRATGCVGIRNVFLDGERIGRVYRVDKTKDYDQHWSGEVVNQKGETWRISEENLADVRERAEEAVA